MVLGFNYCPQKEASEVPPIQGAAPQTRGGKASTGHRLTRQFRLAEENFRREQMSFKGSLECGNGWRKT